MECAIRYDFSFPPKSSSLNNNNGNGMLHSMPMGGHLSMRHQPHQHHQQQQQMENGQFNNIGLSKSASMSLLSCTTVVNGAAGNKANYCNSCNTVSKDFNANNNNVSHNNLNLKNSGKHSVSNGCNGKNGQHAHSVQSSAHPHHTVSNHGERAGNMPMGHSVAPVTPNNLNSSFTFDELRNTLSFMDDSPSINTQRVNHHSASGATTSLSVNTHAVEQLVVNAEDGTGQCVASLSSSSSVSSCSSGSSSSCHSISSASTCNCAAAPGYLHKSNSNPMLLSISTTCNSSSCSISPSSNPAQQKECGCNPGSCQHQLPGHYQPATNSVLDLLGLKKSPPTPGLIANDPPHHQNGEMSSSLVGINNAIENAAKKYRCAAQISEATCCWKGKLPPKQYKTPIVYSTKVFVGGLPWDITEEDIIKEFGVFGPCRVEWTNKDKYAIINNQAAQPMMEVSGYNGQQGGYGNQGNIRRSMSSLQGNKMMMQNGNNGNNNQSSQNDSLNNSKHRLSPGFAYVIYDNEYSVRALVGNCIEDYQNGRDRVEFYFKISTRRVRNKEVQIIPWILADNNFALCTPKELDPKKTVFVGNLHGTMTARDLAHIMNELFGCVVYAGIDIDKLKYPIGSGRVTFSHQQNFMRAVRAAFVDIQSSKFCKRIQIDPYLEDVQCSMCISDKGIYFCRDFQCFNYYCGGCWEKQHSYNQLGNHKPLMRKREDKQQL